MKERSQSLISELRRRAQGYRTSHLLVVHGDDFKVRAKCFSTEYSDRVRIGIAARHPLTLSL